MIKRKNLSTIFCRKVDKLSLEEVEALTIDLWDEMNSDNDNKIRYCLEHRAHILNDQFAPTPQEVEQFRRVAEMLVEKTEMLYQNAGRIYKELSAKYDSGECGDFPMFCVETTLERDCFEDLFESLNNSNKSNYAKFAEILCDVYYEDYGGKLSFASLHYKESNEPIEKYINNVFSCGITNGEVDTAWNCESLYDTYPCLKGIPVCYALHHLATHIAYSMQDILRITNFRSEVKVTYMNDDKVCIIQNK